MSTTNETNKQEENEILPVKGRINIKHGDLVFIPNGTDHYIDVLLGPKDQLTFSNEKEEVISEGKLAFKSNKIVYVENNQTKSVQDVFDEYKAYGTKLLLAPEHTIVNDYIKQHTLHGQVMEALKSEGFAKKEELINNSLKKTSKAKKIEVV